MAGTQYSWKNVQSKSVSKAKKDDNLTKWVGIAIVLAIISHGLVLFAMNQMPVYFGGDDEMEELATDQVVVRSVDDRHYLEEIQDDQVIVPPKDPSEILEVLEMLEEAPTDLEVDFSPTIDEPEMSVEIEMPAIKGDAYSTAEELTAGADLNADIANLGSTEDFIKPERGQITIDAGIQNADTFDPDKFSKELAKGAGGDTENGVIKGFTPLAEMSRLSQSDLNKAKGMIGSDLLYEFGKATLRESAKNSMMKVVLLIDKNPEMYCWIEGHTDLVGDDESNRLLSIARAQAVKTWLVDSMKISPDKLYVRGFGKTQVIVKTGDQKAQALNRRVEIKMRKLPPPEQAKKPRIIKPNRNPNSPAIASDRNDILPEMPIIPPKAVVVDPPSESELPVPPRAIPVEDNLEPSAPIEPKPPKAIPVE